MLCEEMRSDVTDRPLAEMVSHPTAVVSSLPSPSSHEAEPAAYSDCRNSRCLPARDTRSGRTPCAWNLALEAQLLTAKNCGTPAVRAETCASTDLRRHRLLSAPSSSQPSPTTAPSAHASRQNMCEACEAGSQREKQCEESRGRPQVTSPRHPPHGHVHLAPSDRGARLRAVV